jgi:hypothetical protein
MAAVVTAVSLETFLCELTVCAFPNPAMRFAVRLSRGSSALTCASWLRAALKCPSIKYWYPSSNRLAGSPACAPT